MAINDTLADIAVRLRQGRFPNEQAISQGVVLRVLGDLGWDTWDTNTVWPEYQTGEGRADFALCHPQSRPAIFIEVKQLGKAEDGIRQALEYAFHTGVPFVVLTDGRTWSFYLPGEQGSYEDRRVYKLDLFERPAEEAGEALTRYLLFARVESGEVLETARREYRSRNRRARARATIKDAWRELVEKGDESLVELVAETVESKVGIRPDDDDVAEFLVALRPIPAATPGHPAGLEAPTLPMAPASQEPRAPAEPGRRGTLILLGTNYSYANAKEAMVLVLRKLAERDPNFLQQCSEHPNAQGRTRRYIARTGEELYPNRPDLRDYKDNLPGGWFVATNLNNVLKRTIIRLAAEVAGLKYGEDVIVEI